MKSQISLAVISLLFAQWPAGGLRTTAGPLPRERWQRALLPPAGRANAEQCVVLDAEVFAAAAPGLRDVRLLQGERELPYAVDESHDDRETGSTLPVDDRSIFDLIGEAPFHEDGVPPGAGYMHPPAAGVRVAWFLLPAHVPVERIRLLGTLGGSLPVKIAATPRLMGMSGVGDTPAEPETVDVPAGPEHLALPVTLGANLQNDAAVTVMVGAAPGITAVAFEMRRREICYQPITNEPVRMVYGDAEANLIHYDYALHYRPTATPVLAQFGPRERNPAYAAPVAEQGFALTLKQRLGIAIGLCVGMIAVTFGALARMLRKQR